MDGTMDPGVAPTTHNETAIAAPVASDNTTMSSSTASLAVSVDMNVSVPASVELTDSSSNLASMVSTPPTTIRDSASVASEHEHTKAEHAADAVISPPSANSAQDQVVVAAPVPLSLSLSLSIPTPSSLPAAGLATPVANSPTTANQSAAATPSSSRPRRARGSEPTYNLQKLSGTDVHGKRRTKGDLVSERHQRRSLASPGAAKLAASLAPATVTTNEDGTQSIIGKVNSVIRRVAKKTAEPVASSASTPTPASRATRLSSTTASVPSKAVAAVMSKLGKRSRKSEPAKPDVKSLPRELRNLQDTKEFAHIDDRPVFNTYWKNGKEVTGPVDKEAEQPPRKRAKVQEAEDPATAEDATAEEDKTESKPMKRIKQYLAKGLYAGQDEPEDLYVGLSTVERKHLATLPEFQGSGPGMEGYFKFPMFNGLRLISTGRDFKLPFDVCNPLMPQGPRPAGWKLMTKNRFVGESRAHWKKTPFYKESTGSMCDCSPEDGCGYSCHNRIMFYECNDKNCKIGAAKCTNRAFAELGARTAKGGKHRIGVDVLKTEDRGYGVRSNRSFEPGQIIMEYAGEIITEAECDRRMNELYRDNECYYLMSYKGNMIIDATTGSMARFVNHSCSPNCIMTRWIVDGEPRMALFAHKERIEPGDELTYDYNFDPFSSKNVQTCLCGSENCRGVLGPRPKEVKKRKADDSDGNDSGSATKKRKIAPGKSIAAAKKKPLAQVKVSVQAKKTQLAKAKGAAKAVFKKRVSAIAMKGKNKVSKVLKTTVVKSHKNRNGLTIVAAGGMDGGKNLDAYALPPSPTKAKGKAKAAPASKRTVLSAKASKVTKKVTVVSKNNPKKAAPVSKSKMAAITALAESSSNIPTASASASGSANAMEIEDSPTAAATPASPSQASRNGLDIPRKKILLVKNTADKS